MIQMSRAALATFALLFSINHVVLGMGWYSSYQAPLLTALSFGIYLACVLPSILLFKGLVLPLPQAIANTIAAIAVPWLCLSQLQQEDISPNANYLTWFVGGISTLLAITAVRSRLLWAWIGTAAITTELVLWASIPYTFTHFDAFAASTGIVGLFCLVLAATAASVGLRTTREQSIAATKLANETASRTARITAVQSERKNRIEAAIRAAQPVLQRIIDTDGSLVEADKNELILTEYSIRDEIYGKLLVDDGIRIAVRDARRRGVQVGFVVEPGNSIDNCSTETLGLMRTEIARAIDSALPGASATVRAPKSGPHLVVVTIQRPGEPSPDLWLGLP